GIRDFHVTGVQTCALPICPTDSSRGKVLLYLLVTMLPFAVVAPVLGPALDYRRSGRRVLIATSMLGRGVLALLMARWVLDPAPRSEERRVGKARRAPRRRG